MKRETLHGRLIKFGMDIKTTTTTIKGLVTQGIQSLWVVNVWGRGEIRMKERK